MNLTNNMFKNRVDTRQILVYEEPQKDVLS